MNVKEKVESWGSRIVGRVGLRGDERTFCICGGKVVSLQRE